MSQRSSILKIVPPEYLKESKQGEAFSFDGYTCPRCYGKGGSDKSGWMEKFKANPDDPDWTICGVCQGTGQLKAEVVVRWVPTGEVKEQFKVL